MIQITKECNLKSVSFENARGLTTGQKAIVKLLIDKARDQDILTKIDIAELYTTLEPRHHYKFIQYEMVDYHPLDARYGKEKYRSPKHEKITLTKDNINNYYGTMARAMQWFKNNLATCIIKGKILAIPIIEDI